jgi:hypothetical protein
MARKIQKDGRVKIASTLVESDWNNRVIVEHFFDQRDIPAFAWLLKVVPDLKSIKGV